MSKNYDIKRVGKENYHDSKYSFKALQLTPTSNKNIVGNYDKGIRALDEAKRKENLQAVFSKPVEKSAPVKDENISLSDNSVEIDILLEDDIINTKKEVVVSGKKPIRLIPKMYAPISKLYNDEFLKNVKSDVEKEVVEDIQPPVIENDTVEEKEVELKTPEINDDKKIELDYEKISAALEEVAKSRFEREDDSKLISKEDTISSTVDTEDSSKVEENNENKSDRKEQIERFLELKRLIKQQNEDREKAEKANHELAKDEEDASRKYSETFDKFVELNNNLEKEANKNSELISKMLKSNEELSESIAKINRESDELRAMLDNDYEDSESHKKVA